MIPSPKDQTYSPLEVSSIRKDTDLRFSSENLFTSPDTSKEEVRRRESTEGRKDWGERLSSDHITPDKHKENDMRAQESMSDGITCAQRKVVTPGNTCISMILHLELSLIYISLTEKLKLSCEENDHNYFLKIFYPSALQRELYAKVMCADSVG